MRWDEYVEDATAGIVDRRLAREARTELRDHLESAAEALVGAGLERGAAEERALATMGSAAVVGAQLRACHRLRGHLWPVPVAVVGLLVGLLLVVASGGSSPGPAVILAAWSMTFGLLHQAAFVSLARDGLPEMRPRDLWPSVQPFLPFVAAGIVAGAAIAWAVERESRFALVIVFAASFATLEAARALSRTSGAGVRPGPLGILLAGATVAAVVSANALGAPVRADLLPNTAYAVAGSLDVAAFYLTCALLLWHGHRLYAVRSALERAAPTA